MAGDVQIPYTILAQDLTEELTPGNNAFQDVWRITYQGPSGTTAYVRIPASQYNAAAVHAAIQNDLMHIESVHALGQPIPPTSG